MPDLMRIVAEGIAVALAPAVVIERAAGVHGIPLVSAARMNTIVLAQSRTRRVSAVVDAFSRELAAATMGDEATDGA